MFVLIVRALALNSVSINLIVPSLPSVTTALASDYDTIQFIITLFLLANAVGFLFLGTLSDRIGRKPALVGGLILYATASLACALATSSSFLLAARIPQGIGAASGVVVGQAIVRDLYDRARSASVIGYVAVAVGAAPMLAPLLGSLIDERFGWRAIFFLLLAAGTALAIATHLALPETRRTDARRRSVGESLSDVGVLTRNRAFWAFTLVYTSSAGLFYSFFAGTAYASKYILSMSGTDYGYCFILVNLGYSLGAAATGRHARWIGVSRMIVIGGAIGLASTLMMALAFALGAHGALVYFGPMFTINLANGLMQSNAIASVASVRPNLAGTATGLAGALQVAFAAAATVSIGFRLAGIGRELAFALVATGFAALAFGAGLWSQRLSPDGLRS